MGTRAASCLLAIAIAGCGYPDFAFTAEGGVVDGSVEDTIDGATSDTGASDTGAPDTGASDTGAIDTGSDTAAPDTGVADTGAPDTVTPDVGADAAPPIGCVGSHVFCDDFDSSTKPWDNWTSYNLLGGGTATIDTAYVRSAPSAFVSSVPATGTTPTDVSGDINKTFTGASATTPARIDFWVRLDTYYAGETLLLGKLQRGPSGRGVEVAVRKGQVIVDVLGNGTYGTYAYTAKPFNGGQWYHLRLEAILVTDNSGWFRLYEDDMTTPAISKSGFSTTDTTSPDLRYTLGFYANGSVSDPGARGSFDDASFDWL